MFPPITWHSCSLAWNFWVSSNIFFCVWASSLNFVLKSCTLVLYISICSISSDKQSNTSKTGIKHKQVHPTTKIKSGRVFTPSWLSKSAWLSFFRGTQNPGYPFQHNDREYGLKLWSSKKHHKKWSSWLYPFLNDTFFLFKAALQPNWTSIIESLFSWLSL